MGNASSSHTPHIATIEKPKRFSRKRSLAFPRVHVHLGCANAEASSESLTAQETSHIYSTNEKSFLLDVERRPSPPLPPQASPTVYSPTPCQQNVSAEAAFQEFVHDYPEYLLTWILDSLRRTDFVRLERAEEAYVDYMGGSLYPESLIRVHTDFLNNSVLGNTHSVSNSSKLSLKLADEARHAVLTHFAASSEYTVVFTSNTSAALKLVGEAYPFVGGSSLVIGADSHNSVHGIREFATHRNARTVYIPSTPHGGFDTSCAKNVLLRNRPRSRELAPSLFAMTGQSNITNSKNPLSVATYAASLGYHTLVDAAALAPTSIINLSDYPIDAMAVSFYKMFGYPTGVGALVVKKSFLEQLQRPWFAGGTVDVVQVPGKLVTRASELHEQFEDGTINYLQLPAITNGLRILSAYLPFLPLRLSSLLLYLSSSLSSLRHDTTGAPVVQILSKLPTRRLRSVGEQSDCGTLISLLFFGPTGEMLPNSFIEYAATIRNISLRTGCMCNPGGAASMLGIEEQMQQLYPGVTLKDFESHVGRELGVIRISLGLASDFKDVHRVIQFATLVAHEDSRQALWDEYVHSRGSSNLHAS